MEYLVDIGLLVIVIFSVIGGYKSGVIKSTVSLVVLLMSAIIAYQLKDYVASFLIDLMPFVNFGGIFDNITTINILFYHGAAFLVIFIIIYSIFSIVVTLAGFLDKLLKMTIILALPDKLLGAVVGFIKGTIFAFVIIFVLAQLPYTQEYVIESTYGYQVLNRTPVIRIVLADCTVISSDIADIIMNVDTEDENYVTETQMEIMSVFIRYGLITAEKAQELVDDEKVYLPGVIFQ